MMLCEKANIEDLNRELLGSRKYDGVRCLAICRDGKITLLGRSNKCYNDNFPEIVEELKGMNCIFDGEICCENFQITQSRTLTQDKEKLKELQKKHKATYYIFDILEDYGEDLKNKTFCERISHLGDKFSSEYFVYDTNLELVKNSMDIKALWEKAQREKWEGIILKNPEGIYQDKRSDNWLKLKTTKTRDIEFSLYTINNAGIRADNGLIAVQVSGKNSKIFLSEIKKNGKAIVEVEYLEEFDNGKLRMPVCKEVKTI